MFRYTILFLLTGSLWAQVFVVAANPAFPAERLSRKSVANLYMDRQRLLNGRRPILLNLPLESPIRLSFEKKVLRTSRQRLQRYWLKAHFQGRRPPKVVSSEEAAARYIRTLPDAIGYMKGETARNHGLKILYEWRP